MKNLTFKLLVLVMVSTLVSCQSPQQSGTKSQPKTPTEISKLEIPSSETACKSPRPEMCAQVYEPVCATRDTGVRCVTTPCPSTDQVTKSNACTACSDNKVSSYMEGECK